MVCTGMNGFDSHIILLQDQTGMWQTVQRYLCDHDRKVQEPPNTNMVKYVADAATVAALGRVRAV